MISCVCRFHGGTYTHDTGMERMSTDTAKTGAKPGGKSPSKSLSNDDIATYARRSGPAVGGAGTDADAHSDSDAPAVTTDQDTAVATDKDS